MSLRKTMAMWLLLGCAGCSFFFSKLSPDGVHRLEVVHQDDGKGNERLHLSGQPMNGWCGIRDVETRKRGREVEIVVTMRPHGSLLDHDVPIENDTELVSWQGTVIWRRER